MSEVVIREAGWEDVDGIRELFLAVYSHDYPYSGFFDAEWLRRSVYADDIIMLVADDDGRIAGSASVVLDIGAHSDLVGEMGRLAVRPDRRGRGIGRMLMDKRVELVENRLHVGIVENRCVHPYSQRISRSQGFSAVGFLPMKHPFGHRESVALYARHFGNGAALRRNHPRVIPEVAHLAHLALERTGLPADAIVDEEARAYPPAEAGAYRCESLTARGYPALLRIQRGRLQGREIFGPMRLQYGFFKLAARHAGYLVARRPAAPGDTAPLAGAIGWIHDDHEDSVRIFELIQIEEDVARFLLEELLQRCAELGVAYTEVDVSAHAPRMQRTLLELGFQPAAYVPAMVFHDVERLDVVRMVRLDVDLDLGDLQLTDEARVVAELVIGAFARRQVLPRIAETMRHIELFAGLDEEQRVRVAGVCALADFAEGERIFAAGSTSDPLFLLLEGEVSIRLPGRAEPVGTVGAGESLGERALLTDQLHSADAVATTAVQAAVLSRADLRELERMRPDIGLVIYRNLAVGLGRKLARANPVGGVVKSS